MLNSIKATLERTVLSSLPFHYVGFLLSLIIRILAALYYLVVATKEPGNSKKNQVLHKDNWEL